MEILRFDDAGSSTPQRKKSSKGMLVVGLVATLFGISSAFASSTITINGSNSVDLAQGVLSVTGCDPQIGVKPVTTLKTTAGSTNFKVTAVTIGYQYDTSDDGKIDTATADVTTGLGCAGKVFKVQFYKKQLSGDPTSLDCNTLTGQADAAGNALRPSVLSINKLGSIGNTNKVDFKCFESALYFKVTHTQEDINFINPSLDPNSFDYITLESTIIADITTLS